MEDSPIVYSEAHTVTHYSIFIEGALEEPSVYRDAIININSAKKRDKVTIYINSTGGSVDIALSIRNAILSCKAETEAVITGTAASAATFIALACDSLYMYDHTTFMLHDVSVASYYTPMNNAKIRTDYQRRWSENLLIDVYGDFLTTDELILLLEGKDFWFTPEEVVKRLESKLARS